MTDKQKTDFSNIIIKAVTENKIYENVDMDNDDANDFVPTSFRENKVMTRLRDRFRSFKMLKVKEIDQFKKEINTLKTEINEFKRQKTLQQTFVLENRGQFVLQKQEIEKLKKESEFERTNSSAVIENKNKNFNNLMSKQNKLLEEYVADKKKLVLEIDLNSTLEKEVDKLKKEAKIEKTNYDAVVEKNKRLLEMVNNEKLKTKSLENKLADITALYESLLETTY